MNFEILLFNHKFRKALIFLLIYLTALINFTTSLLDDYAIILSITSNHAKNQTKVVPSETSDNDISITMEGQMISSYLEDNNKTHSKNKEKPLTDKFASFTPIFLAAIDNI